MISVSSTNFEAANALFAARGELKRFAVEREAASEAVQQVIGDTGHINGAYDKMSAKAHLLELPLRLRPPYTAAPDERLKVLLEHLPSPWRPVHS